MACESSAEVIAARPCFDGAIVGLKRAVSKREACIAQPPSMCGATRT